MLRASKRAAAALPLVTLRLSGQHVLGQPTWATLSGAPKYGRGHTSPWARPRIPTPVQCSRNLPARAACTLQRLITARTTNAERRPVKASAWRTALKRLLQPLK